MKLEVDELKCTKCGECLKNCHLGLDDTAILRCMHCKPESAACVNACKRNAIFEIAKGVLAVDQKLCNGCGECVKSCPHNAILLHNEKAIKCDLCAENSFFISCVRECSNNALKIKKSEKEQRETEKLIGWAIKKEDKVIRKIESSEKHDIVEKDSGEKIYCLSGFPELSVQEARLVKSVAEEFREQNDSKNKSLDYSLIDFCEKNQIFLDEEQQEYLLRILHLQIFGFGAVGELLEDDNLEEVAAIGCGEEKEVRVYHRAYGWLKTNIYFSDEDSVRNVVNRMARNIGRRLSMQTPKINAVLQNGCRLNATIAPVSIFGPSLTIRKFRSKAFTPSELVYNRTISAEAMAFLSMALQTDCSVLICGNTGSGKTTTLNALFDFVPNNERIIITEETPEIKLKQEHIVKLNVVDELNIGMHNLVVDTLRMRPDRVIVGEIRNKEEVAAFMDTLLAGQGKGSYATFHAQSAGEALARLRRLGVMEIDLPAIDLIVVQKRWDEIDKETGERKQRRNIVSIDEIIYENSETKLNTLFSFDYSKGRLVRVCRSITVMKKLCNSFNCSRNEITGKFKKMEGVLYEKVNIR